MTPARVTIEPMQLSRRTLDEARRIRLMDQAREAYLASPEYRAWATLPTEVDAYAARLRAQHGRKHSFWNLVS